MSAVRAPPAIPAMEGAAAAAAAAGADGDGVHKHLMHIGDDGEVYIHLFAPRQPSLEYFPIYVYNLGNDAEQEFKAMVKARLARARSLAPVLIGEYDVPVLPLLNPETGMSYHIIRLIHTDFPDIKVDLLFSDCDYYFAGFRRAHVSIENGVEEQWGHWFVFGDLIKSGTVPDFLQAVKMGLNSSHRNSQQTKPGGQNSMNDIFFKLAQFQDNVRIVTPGQQDYNVERDEIKNEGEGEAEGPEEGPEQKHREVRMNEDIKAGLVKSVAKIIVVFSEAVRLRSVYQEILTRLEGGGWLTTASELNSRLWNLIKNWGQLSNHIQMMLQEGTVGLDTVLLESEFGLYGFETMTLRDLIGPQGEIMLAKREHGRFITDEELQRLRGMHGAVNIRDPGFPAESKGEN